MAKGTKTGGKSFIGGNKHGAGMKKGYKMIPQKVKEMNRKDVEEVIRRYLWMSEEDIERCWKDKTRPMIDLLIISVIKEAKKKGDSVRFNFLLDRLIGKVKDKVEIDAAVKTERLEDFLRRSQNGNGGYRPEVIETTAKASGE